MKRNLKGKLLSILLCIVMLLACIPAGAVTVNAATPSIIYFKPMSGYKSDGARFAAYFFGNGEKWVSMTETDDAGIYEAEVPSGGYTKVIFCRMNPSSSANNWDNKWNQSGDIAIPTNGNNLCTQPNDAWDGWKGTWSKHTPTTTPEPEPEPPAWEPPAEVKTKTVVLDPAVWNVDGAWFAIYSYTGDEGIWTKMTEDEKSGLYLATISNQYQNFIFCRMNAASQDTTTANRWNYSSELEYPTNDNNMYTIADSGSWNDGGGTWSKVDVNNLPQKPQPIMIGTLYLYPNAAWLEANARYSVYAFGGDGVEPVWFDMSDKDGDGIFEANINSNSYTNVIYVRLNPRYTVSGWNSETETDHVWGQTADLIPLEDGANLYKITEGTTGTKDKGVWDLYEDLSNYSITVSDQTYTGSALKPSVTVKDAAGTTIASSEYTLSYANNTNVGTATVTVTFKNTGAYAGKISKNFAITPASAVIGTVTADVLYDSTNPADVVLHRTNTSIPGTFEITDSVLTYGTNTYNWKFTPTNSNYSAITGTVTVKVAVNSAANGAINFTYNDSSDKEFAATLNGNTVKEVKNGTKTLEEGADYTVSDGAIVFKGSYLKNLDAGSYTFTVSYNPQGVEDDEIQLNESTISVTVAPKTIAIDKATANHKAYDGTTSVKITEVILDGVAANDEVSVDLSSATGALASAEAGAYTSVTVSGAVLTGADAKNYTFGQTSYTVDTTAKVYVATNSEAVTTTVTHTYKASGDEYATVKLNGNTIKAIVNGDTTLAKDEDYFVSEDGEITIEGAYLNTLDAGTYTLTISYKPQGMELEGVSVSTTSITLKVDPKTITISGAAADNKAYDETKDVNITAVTLNGIEDDDVVSADISAVKGTLSSAEAGTYHEVTVSGVVLTGADAKNYKLAEDSYTVETTAAVYVYASSEAVTGTITHTYKDAEDATVNVTLNGNTVKDIVNDTVTLVSGTDYTVSEDGVITFKASYLNTLDAGEYTFIISYNPQGAQISGVTLPTHTVKLSVRAKEISVNSATADNKVYDKTTGIEISAVTLTGVAEGDDVSVDLSKVIGNISKADAGEYSKVTLSALELTGADAKNYKLVATSCTVNVTELIEVAPLAITDITIMPSVTAQVVGKEIILTVKATDAPSELGVKAYYGPTVKTITLTGEDGVYTAIYKVISDAEVGETISFAVYALDGNYVVNSVTTSIIVNEVERTPLPAPKAEDGKEYMMEMESGIVSVPDELKDNEELNTAQKIEDKMQEAIAEKSDNITSSNVDVYDVVLKYTDDDGETWITADEDNFPDEGIKVRLPYPEGTGKATHKFIVAHMFTIASKLGEIEYPTVTLGDDYIEFTVTSLSPISIGWELLSNDDGGNNAGDGENVADKKEEQPEVIPNTSNGSFAALYVLLMMAGAAMITYVLRSKKAR